MHYVQGYEIGRPRPLREALCDMTSQLMAEAEEDTCTVPAAQDANITPLRANN